MIELFQAAIITVLVLWLAFETYYGRRMARRAREALDGWQKAIDLHSLDRATFAGQREAAAPKPDEWPDIIEK